MRVCVRVCVCVCVCVSSRINVTLISSLLNMHEPQLTLLSHRGNNKYKINNGFYVILFPVTMELLMYM